MHVRSAAVARSSSRPRESSQSIQVRRSLAGFTITVTPEPGSCVRSVIEGLHKTTANLGATIANVIAFGPVQSYHQFRSAMLQTFGHIDWPVTWADGCGCEPGCVAGLQVFATAAPVQILKHRHQVVGTMARVEGIQHCWLGGIAPSDRGLTQSGQADETFATIAAILRDAGFSLGDVIRTWFYNDRLLSWYADFNRARTQAYFKTQFRTGAMPASTGISARNPAGAALTASVWAIKPLSDNVLVGPVESPMQCAATRYGSAFSRGMEIRSAGERELLISGTASIAASGATVWQDETGRQIDQTMQVVEAILKSRSCGFSDITRAIAYFKNPNDTALFDQWCREHEVELPAVRVHADICRDDLLFELEADAWTTG